MREKKAKEGLCASVILFPEDTKKTFVIIFFQFLIVSFPLSEIKLKMCDVREK